MKKFLVVCILAGVFFVSAAEAQEAELPPPTVGSWTLFDLGDGEVLTLHSRTLKGMKIKEEVFSEEQIELGETQLQSVDFILDENGLGEGCILPAFLRNASYSVISLKHFSRWVKNYF